jgi:hypothetical protein
VVWLVVAMGLFGPTLVMVTVVRAPEIMDAVCSFCSRIRDWRHPRPAGMPVERLAADLHRLSLNLAEVEGARAPAKMARLRAASMAYDEVLLSACRALEIPEPGRTPLDSLERLEAEAVLAQHGLNW